VLGLRDTTRGMEMRLDILLPGINDPPREMHGLIQMYLEQRPAALQSLRQWFQAMTLDDQQSPGEISVVTVRVTPQTSGRITLYFKPAGFDHPPQRTHETPAPDPYASSYA